MDSNVLYLQLAHTWKRFSLGLTLGIQKLILEDLDHL